MFVCSNCDAQSPKWAGRCTECAKWGTLTEEQGGTSKKKGSSLSSKAKAVASQPLKDVTKQNEHQRLPTGDMEIDRVLGGGIVKGSLVLISGEPGIGKSTMVAAIAGALKETVLYISGEESPGQLAARFSRLGKTTDHVRVMDPLAVETLVATIEKEKPALAIIDSVQTLRSDLLDSTSGTPTLVRYATALLLETAKRTGVSILLVGQVTKDGSIAGPKTLEHLVDVVIELEGDPHAYRMLRSKKNRFGATDEIGVFEMTEKGLIAVANPSERFLAERSASPGSVIAATMEGSRVFLVEVQALVEQSFYGTPVRRASGFDQNRLQMLVAILSKRAGMKLGDKDVYINVIGGIKLEEPAADLAICAAITGAFKNIADQTATIYIGEVGLGGEVRSAPLIQKRLVEAGRLGIERAAIPAKARVKQEQVELKKIGNVKEL